MTWAQGMGMGVVCLFLVREFAGADDGRRNTVLYSNLQ
jgi:hypothetical protein